MTSTMEEYALRLHNLTAYRAYISWQWAEGVSYFERKEAVIAFLDDLREYKVRGLNSELQLPMLR